MRHCVYLPVAMMAAVITAAPARAGWADIPDEPPTVIAAGDFNHDGIADLVEATSPDGKGSRRCFLTVRLGRRDGTFARVASQNLIGNDPRALVVGDFNGDGNPDVIVGEGNGALLEFFGDGKGNMRNAGNIAAVGSVVSMATGHFARDGSLDLVISDFSSNKAAILRGAGDGSFRLTWSFELPKRGARFHIAIADFNKDGLADLVITSEDNDDYEVMAGNGNGTFTYSPELSHLRNPYSYCPN